MPERQKDTWWAVLSWFYTTKTRHLWLHLRLLTLPIDDDTQGLDGSNMVGSSCGNRNRLSGSFSSWFRDRQCNWTEWVIKEVVRGWPAANECVTTGINGMCNYTICTYTQLSFVIVPWTCFFYSQETRIFSSSRSFLLVRRRECRRVCWDLMRMRMSKGKKRRMGRSTHTFDVKLIPPAGHKSPQILVGGTSGWPSRDMYWATPILTTTTYH